jgi:hypothetical protein
VPVVRFASGPDCPRGSDVNAGCPIYFGNAHKSRGHVDRSFNAVESERAERLVEVLGWCGKAEGLQMHPIFVDGVFEGPRASNWSGSIVGRMAPGPLP